jgi:hypothetical protein
MVLRMLSKTFLLTQHDDWTRHLASLNAELTAQAGTRDRAAKLERAGKAAEWLGHYARLLRDGHGVHVPQP